MKYRLEIISIAIAIILGISIFTYLNEQDTNNENKDIKQNNNDTIEDDNKTDDRLVSTWNETLIDLTDYIEPPIWIINDSYISGYDIIKNLNGEFMLVYASDRGNLFKLSRSNDGKTWSRNSTIICSSVWGQNPSIIQNRNGVFFIFINGLDHCWLIKSDDGFNWSHRGKLPWSSIISNQKQSNIKQKH